MTTTPPPQPAAPTINDADTMRRLRVLEERFMNLRRKAQLSEEKLLAAEEKVHTDVRMLTDELVALRRTLADLQESVASLQGEMQHAAPQHELRALEKYLSYWDPMSFVTKEELMRKNLLKNQPAR
jgi:hypothetical protein